MNDSFTNPKKKGLKDAFILVFRDKPGKRVLAYLAEFARADSADYCEDPRKDAYLQGRRSVILEIRNMIDTENDNGDGTVSTGL